MNTWVIQIFIRIVDLPTDIQIPVLEGIQIPIQGDIQTLEDIKTLEDIQTITLVDIQTVTLADIPMEILTDIQILPKGAIQTRTQLAISLQTDLIIQAHRMVDNWLVNEWPPRLDQQ